MTAAAVWLLARVTLVLAAGLLVMPLLRRRSAALRHWVLAAALACAVAQPVLPRLVPAWAVLPAPRPAAAVTTDVAVLGTGTGTGAAPAIATASGPARETRRVDRLLLGIWLGGTLIGLAWLGLGLWRLARTTRRAVPAAPAWEAAAAAIGSRLGLRRTPRVRVTDVPALLVVWGALRPVVLIPADAAEWPADRRDAVLSHELAHVQRHDWIVQIGAAIAGAALWFHPLAWLAGARLRRESELACDDIVLGLGVERTAYASHLIALARAFQARGRAALPAPAIARPSTLQRRIHTMLNAHADRRPLSRFARFAIAAAMACASLPLAAIGQAPGEVSGTLREPSGRVLPGASVRLTQDGSGMKYEAETTPDGQFQLVGVAPGSYVLSAWLSGFDRGVETVTVAANTPLRRDLTLRVASLQETVSVIAGATATPPPTPRRPAAAPAMKPCTASPIGGNIKVPMKIKHVPPVYPAAARDAGIEGTILLVAHIGPDGRVDDVRPFSQGDPDLTDAAIVAVRQWQFTPTLLNCDPIDVRMLVTTRFSSHG